MGFYRSSPLLISNLVAVDGVTDVSFNYIQGFDTWNINGAVVIGNKITNCEYMFADCTSFNQPVTIGSSVTTCSGMFMDCTSFNQPITIPSSVTNCSSMFLYCSPFNQPVTIPSSVTNCYKMFTSCASFNQSVTIGSSVIDCFGMFMDCSSLSRDINIKGTAYRNLNSLYMLRGKNNSKRVNVRFNSVLNNRFNVTNTYSLVGGTITWKTMTNGFYNATYNVYCYYNYAG